MKIGIGLSLTSGGIVGSASAYAQYALALDFKNGTYRNGALVMRDPTALPGYAYTRSGAKSEVATAGTIYPFAANVPGIVPGDGYWSRASLTNISTYSLDFAQASWLASGATKVGVVTGPSADLPGYTISLAARANNTVLQTINKNHAVSAAAYTQSIFVKATTAGDVGKTVDIWLYDATTNYVVTVTLTASWQRVTNTRSLGATANGGFAVGRQSAANGSTAGLVAVSFDICQAQTVLGTQPGPIIITDGAAAAVAADAMRMDYVQANEDFAFWAVATVYGASGNNWIASINDGTVANRIDLIRFGTSVYGQVAVSSAVVHDGSHAPASASGRIVFMVRRRGGKYTSAFKLADGTVVLKTESASLAMPANARLTVGSYVTANQQTDGPVELVALRRGTFSDADITAILTAA